MTENRKLRTDRTSRAEIQNQGIRDSEIDPAEYYPEGYFPELLMEWPVDGDIVVPAEVMPKQMYDSMSQNWRRKKAYDERSSL